MGNILLFGGAFDPVHIGHILTAQRALEASIRTKWDQVWFMPCYVNLFKSMEASAEDRLVMLELAIRSLGNNRMRIFDYEIRNEMEAGTYSIIKRLKEDERYSEHSFGFLMGRDQADGILDWRNGRKFRRLLPIVVVGRFPSMAWVSPDKWFRQNPHEYISPEINDPLSSTRVRANIRSGQTKWIRAECGPLVSKYIFERNLYKGNKSVEKDIDFF